MQKLSVILMFGIIILVVCPNFPIVLAQEIPQKKVREDGVGRIFRIDGKPDPTYKRDTPAKAVYAFLDLLRSNDLKRLREVLGGTDGVLNPSDGKPMRFENFKKCINETRKSYFGIRIIKIDKVPESSDTYGWVHYTANGKYKQNLMVNRKGDTWYVSGANLKMPPKG